MMHRNESPVKSSVLEPVDQNHPQYNELVSPQQVDLNNYQMAKTREKL